MSTAVVASEPDERRGLGLDSRHTLVLVDPETRDRLRAGGGAAIVSWLLFRAGGAGSPLSVPSAGPLPQLWFQLGGRRILAQLRESAGWTGGDAAVAWLELHGGDLRVGAGEPLAPATCSLAVVGGEVTAQLPASWSDRLAAVGRSRD
ncbi:MAG TPA: hypothetical protein VNH20_06800 [Candidatus Dormibacteraeota bacterium]|nr:hypothetical protein [Candidatus Dormibacteraeota bacterium]